MYLTGDILIHTENYHQGLSVTDSEHVLPNLENRAVTRTVQASNIYAKAILGVG